MDSQEITQTKETKQKVASLAMNKILIFYIEELDEGYRLGWTTLKFKDMVKCAF